MKLFTREQGGKEKFSRDQENSLPLPLPPPLSLLPHSTPVALFIVSRHHNLFWSTNIDIP